MPGPQGPHPSVPAAKRCSQSPLESRTGGVAASKHTSGSGPKLLGSRSASFTVVKERQSLVVESPMPLTYRPGYAFEYVSPQRTYVTPLSATNAQPLRCHGSADAMSSQEPGSRGVRDRRRKTVL